MDSKTLHQFIPEGGKVLHEEDGCIVYLTRLGRLGIATKYEATQLFPREWLSRVRISRAARDRWNWLGHALRHRDSFS